jgi:hypothetical protein
MEEYGGEGMKSRVRKYTQKDMYMLCDEVQDVIDDVINANGAIYIIALARMGWGKKRLRDFILKHNEVNSEYARYSREGAFDYYMKKELEASGITYEEVLPKSKIGFKERLREDRKKKNTVSVAEAARMQKQLMNMKEYLENDQRADDKA